MGLFYGAYLFFLIHQFEICRLWTKVVESFFIFENTLEFGRLFYVKKVMLQYNILTRK